MSWSEEEGAGGGGGAKGWRERAGGEVGVERERARRAEETVPSSSSSLPSSHLVVQPLPRRQQIHVGWAEGDIPPGEQGRVGRVAAAGWHLLFWWSVFFFLHIVFSLSPFSLPLSAGNPLQLSRGLSHLVRPPPPIVVSPPPRQSQPGREGGAGEARVREPSLCPPPPFSARHFGAPAPFFLFSCSPQPVPPTRGQARSSLCP